MQVPYDEGVANHIGPESCAGVREGGGEALTGERIGQPLSRENDLIPGADAFRHCRKATRTGASTRAPGRPGVVGDPGMCGRSLYGNREISRSTSSDVRVLHWSASGRRGAVADDARAREVRPRHSSCEAGEQSGRSAAAEPVEPRAGTKGNAGQQSTRRTQGRESVSQALERVRQAARQRKKERFTALLHHISIDLLEEAFFALKRDAAPGVDGVTWQDYEADLDRNLNDLHRPGPSGSVPGTAVTPDVHTEAGRPTAPAGGRRAGGQDRPTGDGRGAERDLRGRLPRVHLRVPARARPARCAGCARRSGSPAKRVNFILDADIRSFFDEVSQEWLVRFLEHRIGDRRIIRLIQKWLKAGVLEDGVVTVSEKGTGQGSVISPLLANIYLHYVFDLWAERWRRREATGDMIIVRYADDIVVGFEHEADARRFWDAMRERLRGVRAVAASGEDPPDRVRPLCGGPTRAARARQAGDLQLPGLHLHLRAARDGANSSSSGRPGATACGRSSGRSRRSCDGACTSRSPSRDNGWGRS